MAWQPKEFRGNFKMKESDDGRKEAAKIKTKKKERATQENDYHLKNNL